MLTLFQASSYDTISKGQENRKYTTRTDDLIPQR